jgi:hypothetical protein
MDGKMLIKNITLIFLISLSIFLGLLCYDYHKTLTLTENKLYRTESTLLAINNKLQQIKEEDNFFKGVPPSPERDKANALRKQLLQQLAY